MDIENRNGAVDSADDIFDPSFAAKIATKTMNPSTTYDAYGNPDPAADDDSQDYIILDEDEGYEMMASLIGGDDEGQKKSSSGRRTKRSQAWKNKKKAEKEGTGSKPGKGDGGVIEPDDEVEELFEEESASRRKSIADIIAELPEDLDTFGDEDDDDDYEPEIDESTGRHRRHKDATPRVSGRKSRGGGEGSSGGAAAGSSGGSSRKKRDLSIDEEKLSGGSGGRAASSAYDEEYFDDGENVEVLDSFSFDDDNTFSAPEWVDSLRRKLNSSVAHAFLLSGNIRDYMVRDVSIKDGIVAMLDPSYDKFDIIAEFDQARGLSFYGKNMETADGRRLSDVYRERFLEQMRDAQKKLSLPVTDDIPNRDVVGLFTVMGYLFDHESKEREARILLFIDHSDFLVPDASSAQMKPDERKLAITLSDIGRSQKADQAGNCMIFMTDDATQLSSRIKNTDSRIERIQLPIPDFDERKDFIDHVLDTDDEDHCLSGGIPVFQHPDSIDKNTFAINTAGLSRIQIEDIVLRSVADDEPLTLQLMKERKNEIIKEDYDDVLEIVDPDHGFERIGGLEHLKNFFIEEVIEPVHAGETEAVPMGVLLMGPPGTSKEISELAIIHTYENGEKYVKDIVPGDKIFGRDGKPYEVTFVTLKGEQEVYEVILADGRKVRCSGDHPFVILEKSHGLWKERIMTPQEMIDKGVNILYPGDRRRNQETSKRARFFLPQPEAVEYPEKDLALDPYVMGCLLGDGCKNTNGDFIISTKRADEETVAYIAEIIGAVAYRKEGESNHSWVFYSEYNGPGRGMGNRRLKIRDVAPEYENLLSGIYCHEKHIPREYLESSIDQRFELLKGMLDTDGGIRDPRKYKDTTPRFNVSLSTTSVQLRDDFMELVYSLGYDCSVRVDRRKGKAIREYGVDTKYKYQHDLYEVKLNVANEEKQKFFQLSRKKEAAEAAAPHKKNRNYGRIPITTVRKTGEKEIMRCLSVDSPDHVFLVNDFIPTHNTFLSKAVAHEANMNFVALNLNRIMEKWVGSTERNLDRALECAMAMAPTIIFIDEIDEALPNRADPNASSVNKRINQRLLTFFSETSHRGQVMILAATNYPEKVDPAFKRAGRFDMRLPMFAPDDFDRMRIMQVIAKSRGYSFSWFENPDKLIDNPFMNLYNWIAAGNAPSYEGFTGEDTLFSYKVTNEMGRAEKFDVILPRRITDIVNRPQITIQQFYEAAKILFASMRERESYTNTGGVETDEKYFAYINEYLHDPEQTAIIGTDEAVIKQVYDRMLLWEQVYKSFADQTKQMTGAELDVVMNKAIILWKRWMRKNPGKIQSGIQRGLFKDDHDIPWKPFLYDACHKVVNAVAGIKSMEDNALLNTSDTDFIPDALYAKTEDNREISYIARHEELTVAQTNAALQATRKQM